MKIKTLAIAAATLAVGAITSQAQVYSQNVVGYVNGIHANGRFELICNPVDATSGGAIPHGNDVTNILAGVAGGTSIQVWNPASSSFTAFKLTAGSWVNQITLVASNNLQLNPGTGFFIFVGGTKPYTNTIAGQVVGPSGTSVTNLIYPGYQLMGSLVPFGDNITNTATFNLIGKGGNSIQTWDPVAQSFTTFKLTAGNWVNQITLGIQVPNISVGQGFFYTPVAQTNTWIQASP